MKTRKRRTRIVTKRQRIKKLEKKEEGKVRIDEKEEKGKKEKDKDKDYEEKSNEKKETRI